MLSVRDALRRCLDHRQPVRPETVGLSESSGRVLAEDVVARVSLPPWDNSAMDGYALGSLPSDEPEPEEGSCVSPRMGDFVGDALRVVEVIPAGVAPARRLGPGQAARIFTGAPVPEGAVAVVMQEETDLGGERVRLRRVPREGANIRRAGEDVQAGEVVLRAGQTLTPARVGLLSAVGATSVAVARRPRVAIVSTGDEVVPAGEPLRPGQIYSSNTAALSALISRAGAIPVDCGIAPDTVEGVRTAFGRALRGESADFIVTTGGVSVGDFDVVREAMAEEGAEMTFWKVRMKPGKPLAYGVIGGIPTFGLPGNPVSCFVNFLVFVRPVLRQSLGDPRPYLPVWPAVLTTPLRKRAGRSDLQRVSLRVREDGVLEAARAGLQGSHVLSGLSAAQGLALLGPDETARAVGETVSVMVFEPESFGRSSPGFSG